MAVIRPRLAGKTSRGRASGVATDPPARAALYRSESQSLLFLAARTFLPSAAERVNGLCQRGRFNVCLEHRAASSAPGAQVCRNMWNRALLCASVAGARRLLVARPLPGLS